MDLQLKTLNNNNNIKIKFHRIKSQADPHQKNKLSRYDSAIFLNNYMQNKKIIKPKDYSSIRKIEFSFPNKKILPQKRNSRNIFNFRLKKFYKNKSSIQINKAIKLIPNYNYNNILNPNRFIDYQKNKNDYFPNKLYKQFNIINDDKEKNNMTKTFYSVKIQKTHNLKNSFMNKFTETEKPEKIIKEIIPLIETDRSMIKDKLPINTLKHYHRYLFHNNKNNCKCFEEEKGKINNYDYSQGLESSSQFNNKVSEYDVIELGGKKNYVATKLTKPKRQNEKNLNNSETLIALNLKKKDDFHYIMKHPFSNSFFCSSFINQLTDNNNNSYTNNFSERFQNLLNPLSDKDLTDKIHNLILNPNTSKIRNGELFLMYKNFPKGIFYNIYKNNKNNIINSLIYNEELKKSEKTKYKKYIIKLNKTIERAKSMQKKLNTYIYINKKIQ